MPARGRRSGGEVCGRSILAAVAAMSHRFHGSSSATPLAVKSSVLRVTTVIPVAKRGGRDHGVAFDRGSGTCSLAQTRATVVSMARICPSNRGRIRPLSHARRISPWRVSRRSVRRTPSSSSNRVIADR